MKMALKISMAPWHPDTHRLERPEVQPEWTTLLQNGDLQVIYAIQQYGGYHLPSEQEGELRYRYFIATWNEGHWHPIAQNAANFDVERHLKGAHCIERVDEIFSKLYRKPNPDRRPLYTQGYLYREQIMQSRFAELPVESMTKEWYRGEWAADLDWSLKEGYVHTSCEENPDERDYQPLGRVQWLF